MRLFNKSSRSSQLRVCDKFKQYLPTRKLGSSYKSPLTSTLQTLNMKWTSPFVVGLYLRCFIWIENKICTHSMLAPVGITLCFFLLLFRLLCYISILIVYGMPCVSHSKAQISDLYSVLTANVKIDSSCMSKLTSRLFSLDSQKDSQPSIVRRPAILHSENARSCMAKLAWEWEKTSPDHYKTWNCIVYSSYWTSLRKTSFKCITNMKSFIISFSQTIACGCRRAFSRLIVTFLCTDSLMVLSDIVCMHACIWLHKLSHCLTLWEVIGSRFDTYSVMSVGWSTEWYHHVLLSAVCSTHGTLPVFEAPSEVTNQMSEHCVPTIWVKNYWLLLVKPYMYTVVSWKRAHSRKSDPLLLAQFLV